MKLVSVETPEKSVCKMTFSATAEELETASNAVYERTRASYTIKGFAKGYRSFVLVGCLGGARFDHSLANLEVLQYILQHSGYGVMADSHTKVFLIAGSRLRLTEMKGATVSVFPYGTASCTVTYQGLLYPLAHDTLTSGGVLMGVSNTITADTAVIRVHAGTALVVGYTA